MRSLILPVICVALVSAGTIRNGDEEFREWYQEYQTATSQVMFEEVDATWNYNTDITDQHLAIMLEKSAATAAHTKAKNEQMTELFQRENLKDPKNLRLFDKLSKMGDAALSKEDFDELAALKSNMETIYSTAKICRDPTIYSFDACPDDQQISLDPHITEIMDKERDPALLKHVWKAWRDASGKHMRENYIKYIELKNKAARENGYSNAGQAWRAPYVEPEMSYTDEDFLKEIDVLWNQMRPLYEELHAYVRGKLRERYPYAGVTQDGPIPAHLLGNMWAQTWLGLLDFTQLYPNRPALDVSAEMIRQNWNATYMFQISDKFFKDLGLIEMPPEFWEKSMLEKPADRDVVCHASAWDFYNQKDFRVKQCTVVNMQDLFTVHHEMGHVEYFLQYKDQEITFRDGANDGFHEAIGDVLALSVSTPGHLRKIGLLAETPAARKTTEDAEMDLNFMFSTAMEKIAFLPFGLLMDKYRYEVFEGKIETDELNARWWDKLVEYQGVCSPVARTEDDFDPGAKFHIPADVPYMRYFVSFVIQFQFHEALCQAAGHTGPLYTCDIDGSVAAGKLLGDALKLGSSRPWQVAMKAITGQEKMDAGPLLRFFEPLMTKLKEINTNNGNVAGWKKTPLCDMALGDFLDHTYGPAAERVIYKATEASWAYNTNITDYNRDLMNKASTENAEFDKQIAKELKKYNVTQETNATITRLYDKLTKLGDSGLKPEKYGELLNVSNRMSEIYNKAKVCRDSSKADNCPQNELLSLEPEITQEMAKSRDPNYLLYLWKAWRDATGRHMRTDYKRYVELKNEGAQEDGYDDNGQAWRSSYVEPSEGYSDADFLNEVNNIWAELEPFYKELHAYVRHQLREKYGDTVNIKPDGPIPAHLLGNMWAQTWGNLLDFTQPYERDSLDVTPQMVAEKYNATTMFRLSDQFFTDLGLEPMPQLFWDKSMIEKPDDRDVTCHASAWDFYNRKDFRVKQCTAVNMEDLLTVHHEMGHVEYYLLYKHQPIPFRRGANDGFHEAVGDVISLSVSTPAHLKKVGLLPNTTELDDEMDLNFMLNTALDKIAFLPFGFMMDMYRYDIFNGKIQPEQYNTKWWEYILKYQGLCAPVKRSEEDFDAGAKYHIPADVPYMRYFTSFIMQFQFHKAACEAANHTGPLHQCDIDGSKAAGDVIRSALSLGSSQPWQVAMEEFTGQKKMTAEPLLEYFQPIRYWLQGYIKAHDLKADWTNDIICEQPSGSTRLTATLLAALTVFWVVFREII